MSVDPFVADARGWIPVNSLTLETSFPGVYAVIAAAAKPHEHLT